jgi:hypothetical protein
MRDDLDQIVPALIVSNGLQDAVESVELDAAKMTFNWGEGEGTTDVFLSLAYQAFNQIPAIETVIHDVETEHDGLVQRFVYARADVRDSGRVH